MKYTYAKNTDASRRQIDRSICSTERRPTYPVDANATTARHCAVRKERTAARIIKGIVGWLATPISSEAAADHGPWARL
jgi:hypothetical protein